MENNIKDLSFSVTKDVLDLEVKIVTARITGVTNTPSNNDFETYKTEELEKIKESWNGKSYKDDPILQGFRDLHTKVGRSNRDYIASPEVLTSRLLKNGYFPHINTVVDIYNIISLKSHLALGAHDIEKVNGNITLKITDGTEQFTPLGKTEPEQIFPGEYGYVDEGNNVICRLEVLQSAFTLVTPETTDIFLIIQGDANTEHVYVENAAKEVCKLITKYCGGSYTFL